MSQAALHCEVCQAFVDVDDLFCSNCGTEAPLAPVEIDDQPTRTTHNFICQGCGASMSYDAGAQSLRCPFCGSTNLDEDPQDQTLLPQHVIHFATDPVQIRTSLRKWLGSSYWRPSDLASTAQITNVTAVYVPYWIFRARTDTYWTADSSRVPFGARGDWVPVTGAHRGEYRGVLIGASSVLTQAETGSICPFNMDAAQPYDAEALQNHVVEQFRVQRKYARPLARQTIEAFEREACRKYVPGRARNVNVNVRLEGLVGKPVLLPIWILAYRYKGDIYRFLANGQTGKHSGAAPFSWFKLAMVIGIVLLVFVVLILVVSGLGVALNG